MRDANALAQIERAVNTLHLLNADPPLTPAAFLKQIRQALFMLPPDWREELTVERRPVAKRVVCADGSLHSAKPDTIWHLGTVDEAERLDAFDSVNACGPHRVEPLSASAGESNDREERP